MFSMCLKAFANSSEPIISENLFVKVKVHKEEILDFFYPQRTRSTKDWIRNHMMGIKKILHESGYMKNYSDGMNF